MLADDAVSEALTSEVEQSYIFKRYEPVVSWTDSNNAQSGDMRKLFYSAVQKNVIENLKKAIPEVDAVILSDYHIGTLTKRVIDKTIEIANKHKKIVVVDAQKNLETYRNITSMTPNLPDTQKSVGFFINNDEDLKKAGDKLLKETRAKSILITCGADGMFVKEPNKKYTKIPVFNKSEVFDVTGAGDTVTAVDTLALAAGADSVYAALIGNIAASLVVKQFGCATTTISELLCAVENIL